MPYSPLKFETTIITTLLPEVYSIIQYDNNITELLIRLRLQLGTINSEISRFHSFDPNDMEFQADTHNEYIRKYIRPLHDKDQPKGNSSHLFLNRWNVRRLTVMLNQLQYIIQ